MQIPTRSHVWIGANQHIRIIIIVPTVDYTVMHKLLVHKRNHPFANPSNGFH